MAATAIVIVPSFASVGSSLSSRKQVVTTTRNLSYPSRPTAYPSWSNEEKPIRLFTHEECRASPSFRHMPATPNPTPVNPLSTGQNTPITAQNGQQHAVLRPAWCLAVLKKLRNFGHRIFSQLSSAS